MLSSKSFVLFGLLAIYLGYNFNNTYVYEQHDEPFKCRVYMFISKIFTAIAVQAYKLGIAHEATVFRNLINTFSSPKFDKFGIVDIENRKINSVNVRIYSPKSELIDLPIMIFIHGGAYIFGSLNSYDSYLINIAKRTQIKIISIDYRLAPEFPYPNPTNDCWSVLNYVLQNPKEFNINPEKLILAGDSAGGNAVLVLSQRIAEENKKRPKFQILIYPWTQLATQKLPSKLKYKKGIVSAFSFTKYVLWYLGIKDVSDEMEAALLSNNVTLLLTEQEKQKFKSALDVNLIPNEYKQNKKYYQEFKNIPLIKTGKLDDSNILVRDKEFADKVKLIYSDKVSPGLADLDKLKNQPKTYEIICEWDGLKDESLILAERLKKAGVEVNVAFYEKCFHGMVSMVEFWPLSFSFSEKMLHDLVEYIKINI